MYEWQCQYGINYSFLETLLDTAESVSGSSFQDHSFWVKLSNINGTCPIITMYSIFLFTCTKKTCNNMKCFYYTE